MANPTSEAASIPAEIHRQLAAAFFNDTWRLLNQQVRTDDENNLMVHSAHASRMHWEFVGDETNRAIGEWQIARVYTVVGLPESAVHHAMLCLCIVEKDAIQGFLLGCAHEIMARALAGIDRLSALDHYKRATAILGELREADEKQILGADLESVRKALGYTS